MKKNHHMVWLAETSLARWARAADGHRRGMGDSAHAFFPLPSHAPRGPSSLWQWQNGTGNALSRASAHRANVWLSASMRVRDTLASVSRSHRGQVNVRTPVRHVCGEDAQVTSLPGQPLVRFLQLFLTWLAQGMRTAPAVWHESGLTVTTQKSVCEDCPRMSSSMLALVSIIGKRFLHVDTGAHDDLFHWLCTVTEVFLPTHTKLELALNAVVSYPMETPISATRASL